MIFLRYSSTLIEANCYILADTHERVALVVDPGAGSSEWIASALEERSLTLGAVLCTHGHMDHVWDSALVAGDAPVYIPQPDLYRMDNPAAGTPALEPAFVEFTGHEWVRPATTQALGGEYFVGGGAEIVPGITIRAVPAPGHSEGSTVFLFSGTVDPDRASVNFPEGGYSSSLMLSGDVIFRDGVGRTDLPGGDEAVAAESLRMLCRSIDPQTVFFPGHGPSSTLGREIRHSYYLRSALGQEQPSAGQE